MKLVRYGAPGKERPGLIDGSGTLRDLSAELADIDGAALDSRTLDMLRGLASEKLPAVSGRPRLGPPLGKVGKIIAVGLNYTDHAIEANLPVPTEPTLFMKSTTAIVGPYDDVVLPKNS